MIICENKSPLFIEIINLSLDILLGLLYSVCYFSGWNIYGNVCYLCELWYLTTAALSMPNKCECLRSRLYVSTNNRSTKRKSASNLLIMSVLLSPGCQKQVNNTICSFVEAIPQTAVPFEPFWLKCEYLIQTCTWPDWSCDVTRFWLWMDRRSCTVAKRIIIFSL